MHGGGGSRMVQLPLLDFEFFGIDFFTLIYLHYTQKSVEPTRPRGKNYWHMH